MSLVDIICVTYNSPEYAVPCVRSILRSFDNSGLFHLYVVNNGAPEQKEYFPKHPALTVLNQEKNLGWEGGLKAGLAESKSAYVVFMNDDTFVPDCSHDWLRQMMRHFVEPKVAAVGPSSNFVMGLQGILQETTDVFVNHLLIGFCVMFRRSDLDAVGGVDDTLPGGDDFDFSLRLRKAGKMLVVDKNVFIFHHGQKTGRKVHGDLWDSINHQERVKFGLVHKHGLRGYMSLFSGPAVLA